MNSYIALFFLGLIQGLTEFLPVSSSGHLVLFSAIFGIEESLSLSIILHVATLFSIVCVFWRDIWQIIRHPLSPLSISLAIATIPTCVIVLLLKPLVEASFTGVALPICFLISAVVLALSQKNLNYQKISNKTAFFMGVAQGFAVFPGISRSGATISAGLFCGADKAESAKFSFLMSVPIILMSLVLEIFEVSSANIEFLPTLLAFVTAFLSGIFAIKFMINLTQKTSFLVFSVYLMAISVISFFVL